jgi:hypothetical protein
MPACENGYSWQHWQFRDISHEGMQENQHCQLGEISHANIGEWLLMAALPIWEQIACLHAREWSLAALQNNTSAGGCANLVFGTGGKSQNHISASVYFPARIN